MNKNARKEAIARARVKNNPFPAKLRIDPGTKLSVLAAKDEFSPAINDAYRQYVPHPQALESFVSFIKRLYSTRKTSRVSFLGDYNKSMETIRLYHYDAFHKNILNPGDTARVGSNHIMVYSYGTMSSLRNDMTSGKADHIFVPILTNRVHSGHATLLAAYPRHRAIVFFDPNGYTANEEVKSLEQLIGAMVHAEFPGFQFTSMPAVCPMNTPQRFEGLTSRDTVPGYCMLYVLAFVIKSIDSQEFPDPIKIAAEMSNKDDKNNIRRYANLVVAVANKKIAIKRVSQQSSTQSKPKK